MSNSDGHLGFLIDNKQHKLITGTSNDHSCSLGSIIWNFCKKDIFPLKNPNSNQVQL